MNTKLVELNTLEQCVELAAIAADIWNEYYSKLLSQQQIDYMLEQFQSVEAIQQQLQQGYQYYFIVKDQSIAGYAATKQEEGSLFLSKLYVKKDWRGQGCGGAALKLLRNIAESHQLRSIWLTVNRYNTPSIAIYERAGFSIVDEQVADIGHGYVMDDYIMKLSLA